MSTEHLIAQFGQVLDALMSAAEGPRQEAEKYLRRLTVDHPGEVLLALAQIGAQGVGGYQLDHRFLSLILLNRLSFRPLAGLFLNPASGIASSPFDCIAERTRSRIEVVICAGLKDEMNVRMRKGLGTCAATWAEESSKRQRPVLALPPILIELTSRKEPFHRFTPYQIMTLFPTLLIDSVSAPLPASQFAQILMAGLHDPAVDVRVETVKAIEAVLSRGMRYSERKQVGPSLIAAIFQILPEFPIETLKTALLPIVELSWDHPSILKPSLPDILSRLVPLLAPPPFRNNTWSPSPPPSVDYEDWMEYANPAQEIICAMSNHYAKSVLEWEGGRLVKEIGGLMIGRMVVQLSEEGEEQSDWLKEENIEFGEYDVSTPCDTLQRLSLTFESRAFFDTIFDSLEQTMTADQSEWEIQCAGLMCFSAVLPSSPSAVKSRLQEIVTVTAKCANHPHFRVRYAFLHCMGELCHAGRDSIKFGNELVQLCLTSLTDPVERVRAQSTTTLTDILATLPSFNPTPVVLRPIVEALCNAYNNGQPFLKERVLTALSDIETRVIQDVDFVRALVEFYLRILSQSNAVPMRKVIGRAVECATVPVFIRAQYKHPELGRNLVVLAELLLRHQNDITTHDDPRARFLIDGWMAFAKALRKDFAPFLQFAVPFTLKIASVVPASQVPNLGSESLTVDTSKEDDDELDEWGDVPDTYDQAGAIHALAIFGIECPGGMSQWVEEGMKLGLEGMKSKAKGMKSASCALIPSMLNIAKLSSHPIDLSSLLLTILKQARQLEKEEDTDFAVLKTHLTCLVDCCRIIGVPLPPAVLIPLLELWNRTSGLLGELVEIRNNMGSTSNNDGTHTGFGDDIASDGQDGDVEGNGSGDDGNWTEEEEYEWTTWESVVWFLKAGMGVFAQSSGVGLKSALPEKLKSLNNPDRNGNGSAAISEDNAGPKIVLEDWKVDLLASINPDQIGNGNENVTGLWKEVVHRLKVLEVLMSSE